MTGPQLSVDGKGTAATVAGWLNSLPMVEWDRCGGDVADWLVAYGWIPRDDDGRDFVTVSFRGGFVLGYITSSAEHTEAIGAALNFDTEGHKPCIRISEEVPGLERLVPWQSK